MIALDNFARKPVDHGKEWCRHADTLPDTKPLYQIDQHLFARRS